MENIKKRRNSRILRAIGTFLVIWIFGKIALDFFTGESLGFITFIIGIIVANFKYKDWKRNEEK